MLNKHYETALAKIASGSVVNLGRPRVPLDLTPGHPGEKPPHHVVDERGVRRALASAGRMAPQRRNRNKVARGMLRASNSASPTGK